MGYLRDRAALSVHEITTNIDRYIAWRGQALPYKLGELQTRHRGEAEEKLGAKFDRRRFHDTILAIGSVPLPVLEEHIARFIASELANAAKQEREEPQRHRARLIFGRLGVDSRHQDFVVSTVYTMARTPDLLPGTLDLLILRTLQKDALHGWAVSERIQQISQDVLQINQGSLYPALHRLEHQGWIEAEWRVSELGRRAKYYHLTASGRRQLAVEAREWERMANAIGRVMKFA